MSTATSPISPYPLALSAQDSPAAGFSLRDHWPLGLLSEGSSFFIVLFLWVFLFFFFLPWQVV